MLKLQRKNLIISIVLCVLILTSAFICGCKKQKTQQSASSSVVSSSQSGAENINPYEVVDRTAYSIENLSALFVDYKTSDFISAIESNTLFKDAQGFMVGDVFNSLIKKANESFPSGSNISNLIGFTYYNDNNWYNNSTGLKSHKVMNAFLSYKLDGSEKMAISNEDLQVYGENKIVDFTGYTKSVIEILNTVNPLVYYLTNSTLNDWFVLLQSENVSERILTLYKMVGDSTLKDVLKLIDKENEINVNFLLKDVISVANLYGAVKYDSIKVLACDLWASSESGKSNEILQRTFTYNGKKYTVNSAIDHLLCKNNAFESVKEIALTTDLKTYISGLYAELNSDYGAELFALVESYIDEYLNNPSSGEQTIDEIANAINLSENQKETLLCYCFDVLSYVDNSYGQEIETDGLTLSDVILHVNEFFAGQNTYNSLTVKQLTAFFKGLNKKDLIVFATDTIEKNEVAIINEIDAYKTNNPDKNVTLTFESLVVLSKNANLEGLSDGDIELLNTLTLSSIIKQNGKDIYKTEVLGVDELFDELLKVNLYEIIFGLSDERVENVKLLINDINVFEVVNFAVNKFNSSQNS